MRDALPEIIMEADILRPNRWFLHHFHGSAFWHEHGEHPWWCRIENRLFAGLPPHNSFIEQCKALSVTHQTLMLNG